MPIEFKHKFLTLKCSLQSDKLKKSQYKIRYNDTEDWNQNLSKLLSQIVAKFKFLSEFHESEWTISIKEQIIDKQDAKRFGTILSSIPSNDSNPVILEIVRPTTIDGNEGNNNSQFEKTAKFIIIIHHDDQQFKYGLHHDSEEWDDETFETLNKEIANRFNIDGSFEILTKDNRVDIDDIECLQDEFDSLESDNTIHVLLKVMTLFTIYILCVVFHNINYIFYGYIGQRSPNC